MYAFRHVPPRMFKNKLKHTYTSREEAVYLAHRKLHPKYVFTDNIMIGPTAYRKQYNEIFMAAPNDWTLHEGEIYKSQNPTQPKGLKGRLHQMNIQNKI